MNIASPKKLVVLGFMSHFPVAGVAWQTLHYLLGFQKLGYEVYYVEAHGCTASKLMQHDTDDGPGRAAAYISGVLNRFGLGDRWAYHALYESRHLGLTAGQLKELYGSAALLINLHGSHIPTPELSSSGRLVYLETDPVDLQIDLYRNKPETIDYLSPHCAFFSFGENLGKSDCLVPSSERFTFLPTRQPVVLDLWEHPGGADAELFTTIGNWRQPWREFTFKGESFRWSKHLEFQKFLDLPRRTPQGFELALSSYTEADRQMLVDHGWRVRHALEFSQDLDAYRSYIAQSRGEFTVAKDQNIRLRSGWFSDRAATYLAAGRPVITQETAFSNSLPTGEGLFAFSTMDDILHAVEAINSNYPRHCRAATRIAREFMSHEVVLGKMLDQLGLGKRRVPKSEAPSSRLPGETVLTAVSRWPTRLPEETVEVALGLTPEAPSLASNGTAVSVSVVIVTHNSVHFSKMCVASLFANQWAPADELIFVDNASSDGTVEFLNELRRTNPFVRLILNPENRGFAAGNNQGLAQAKGEILILLNNDTIMPTGWRGGLVRWLEDPGIGLVGPVTNRACNEAQIDAPYRTYAEMQEFAQARNRSLGGQCSDLPMVAMFCVALRRNVFQRVGFLDERFGTGMFEDDDYSRRVRQAGYRVICAEDVFVHHFGQGSLGELCLTGEYDQLLEQNRRKFEEKWGVEWQPHGRRLSPEYAELRKRVVQTATSELPSGATVVVISKGDEELLKLGSQNGWHFPQTEDGRYANWYPALDSDAVAQLEKVREKGARFLIIPKPAFWWLKHYKGFGQYLERHCRLALKRDDTCLIYELGRCHA
jgi:GT2 family glycosyltransferase